MNTTKKSHSSFARRAVYLFTAALLAIFAFLAIRSYRLVDRDLTSSALARRTALASLAAATLSEELDRLVDIGIALATRVRFRQLIAAGNWAQAIEILRSVPSDFDFIERVFLTDVHGTEMADYPSLPGVIGRNFAFRQWYKKVSERSRPAISPVYRRTAMPQHNVFSVPVPILGSDARLLGYLVLQVRLSSFFEWAKNLDLGSQGIIYVVDSRGQAAFHPAVDPESPTPNFADRALVRRLLSGEQGVQVTTDPVSGVRELTAYASTKQGWGAVVEQPVNIAFASRDAELRRVALGYLLLLVLAASLAYLGARLASERRQAATERRNALVLERTVKERTSELEATNKELESFSYSVSHDLRAPLRAIDGFAQMLEEDFGAKLDGEGRRLLGIVRQSARNMGRLIDDLLAFSRMGRKPLSAGRVDSAQLVAEVLSELRDAASRAEVSVSSLPEAWADRSTLKQVWANLIGNALKYSSRVSAPRIEIGGREEAAENVYWVRDNGVGFDMRYVEKLFGVFQRLHSEAEFPGTGVGLAIVRRVVTRHGGHVWAEGRINESASFYFSLPRREQT